MSQMQNTGSANAAQLRLLLRQKALLKAHADPQLSDKEARHLIAEQFSEQTLLSWQGQDYSYAELSNLAAVAQMALPTPVLHWLNDGKPAQRARAGALLKLCGVKAGRRFALCAADPGLQLLALAMAWFSASSLDLQPNLAQDGAKIQVLLSTSAQQIPLDLPENACVLLFAETCTEQELQRLQALAAPCWQIISLPQQGQDLLAINLKTGHSRPLQEVQICNPAGHPELAGRSGQLRLSAKPELHSGRYARLDLDGQIRLLPFANGDIWWQEQPLALPALAAQMRTLDGLRELEVLSRRRLDGSLVLLVCYASLANVVLPVLEAQIRELAARHGVEPLLLPLPRLPRDEAGGVDLPRLAAFPVLDDKTCKQQEALILQQVEGGMVSSSVQQRAAAMMPLAARPTQMRAIAAVSLPQAGQAEAAEAAEAGSDALACLQGPELHMPEGGARNLAQLLLALEGSTRELIFISAGQELRISYAQLLRAAQNLARHLQAGGQVAGGRAILQIAQPRQQLLWFWACQLLGLCVTPLGVSGDREADLKLLARTCERLQAGLLVTQYPQPEFDLAAQVQVLHPDQEGQAAQEPSALTALMGHSAQGDDCALILLTSGSTSEPKLVPQTHAHLLAQGYASGHLLGLGVDAQGVPDVSMNWMPLDHVGGLVMWHLRDVQLGVSQIHVSREDILARPLLWFELVQRYRVSLSWAPNFAYALLAAALKHAARDVRWDLSSLRYLVNGGEAVVPEVVQQFLHLAQRFGLNPQAMKPAWGMSETCSLVAVDMAGVNSLADGTISVGQPLAGCAFRIVNAQGEILRQGQQGLLEVRAASVTDGYLDLARAQYFSADGWFRTGDLALISAHGLGIAGRDKDVIVINGQNVSALALERQLMDMDGIDPTQVVALAYRAPGSASEIPALFFVAEEVAREAVLAAQIRQHLRACMQLEVIALPVRAQQIPRTNIGKPQRQQLQKRLQEGEFAALLQEYGVQAQQRLLPPWFFRPQWQACRAQSGRRAAARWVLLAAPQQGAELGAALQAAGVQLRCLEWPQQQERVPDLHLQDDENLLLLPSTQAQAMRADLVLLACIKHNGAGRDLRGLVLTREAFDPVLGPLSAAAAGMGALFGLLASMHLEQPQLALRWLDVGVDTDWPQQAQLLLKEAASAPDHLVVRYRQGVREVPVLQPERFLQTGPLAVRQGGVYLVAGALGALGQLVCEYLLHQCGARVIGLGRWDPQQAGAQDQEQEARTHALHALQREPGFQYVSADVTRREALLQTLAPISAGLGGLDGVFHLGAEFALQEVAQLPLHQHVQQTAAKIDGSLHLIDLLREQGRPQVEHLLVLFGSVNSWFGGVGAGSYSAACAAQQFIAEHCQQPGLKAYYLGWSQWRQMGLSRKNAVADLAARNGFMALDIEAAMASLDLALCAAPGVLLIGLQADHGQILAQSGMALRSPVLRLEISTPATAPAATAAFAHDAFGAEFELEYRWQPLLTHGKSAAQYRALEQSVCAIWREVLGGGEPDVNRNFFEQGGNSLRLLQLKARLEQHFCCQLAVTDLFRLANIRQLSMYLLSIGIGADSAQAEGAQAEGAQADGALAPDLQTATLEQVALQEEEDEDEMDQALLQRAARRRRARGAN